jgi:hypothetical protein
MDPIRASAFTHIVLSIVLVGLALYWMIMVTALKKRHGAAESERLLQIANRARWPHAFVPPAWRIPLPWISWLALAALVATGGASILLRGTLGGMLWWIKLALVVAIIAIQVPLTRRPHPNLVRINFALVLAVILVSGWALR